METPDYLCSALSLEAHEPLYGSAPEKRVWLLLEYDRPWGARVLPESALPDTLKNRLSSWMETTPGSNVQFIRQPGESHEGIRLYVAVTDERDPRLYEFTLADYADLIDLALEAAVAGDPTLDDRRVEAPLYLVCTNAKRDKCCAKYGLGVYHELAKVAGDQAWQCSHIGGHRFAPTSLFFPHGVCYGRIQVENVADMVEAYRGGDLYLDHLRGRVCYDPPVQAAEVLLRSQLGLTRIDALTLSASNRVEPNCWDIEFDSDGQKQNVRLEKLTTDVEIYTSCFNDKREPVEQYRLI